MGKTANKITSANFKPSEGDGRFQVYSKQFNDLVDVVGENQQLLSTQILNSGGGTLDQAYDNGGAGLGRTIVADKGAVKIEGADGLLVTGVAGDGADSEWVGGGAYDTGMFFNPKKAAFRAGYVHGTQWDDANIGSASTAIGVNNIASGDVSTAIGVNNIASGENSTAMGAETTASGENSTAMGGNTIASGDQSTAMGGNTTASGNSSTAMGISTTASGNRSTTIGSNTTALSFVETVIGFWNTAYAPVSTSDWEAADRLFGIGNGIDEGLESDALVVLKNGKITCPSTTGSFTPNVLTTAERDALTATAGMLIYNSTTDKLQCYDGTIWNDLY